MTLMASFNNLVRESRKPRAFPEAQENPWQGNHTTTRSGPLHSGSVTPPNLPDVMRQVRVGINNGLFTNLLRIYLAESG
jgi:hypothetical protein